MKRIRRTNDIVKDILETVPEARNSDMLLYYRVCERLNHNSIGLPFGIVIVNLKELNLPPFESVRRTRQKLQASYPELRASDEVDAWRKVNEEYVKDYARGVTV